MNIIPGIHGIPNTVAYNRELSTDSGILRRILRAELIQIHGDLMAEPGSDEIKVALLEWTRLFKEALTVDGDEQQILENFKRALRELLTDPFTNAPLGRNALLGSDGYTYDPVTLDAYRRLVSPELRNRSPSAPADPTPFTTRLHPLVGKMIDRLESHDLRSNPNLTQRRDRLRAIVASEDPVRNTEIDAQALEQKLLNYATQRFDEIRIESELRLAPLSTQIQAEHQSTQEFRTRFTLEIETVEQQYHLLEIENQQQWKRLQNIEAGLNELDRAHLKVQAILTQIKIEPKKRKKRFLQKLLEVSLIVGAGLFATWALNAALATAGGAASNASAYLAPTRGGGAGINFSFHF